VIGVSWAFLMAGCPTTVVTQSKASSAASALLMVDFHRHLVQVHNRREHCAPRNWRCYAAARSVIPSTGPRSSSSAHREEV